jgi:hypothetical protein
MKKIAIVILFTLIAQIGFSQKDSPVLSEVIFNIGASSYSSTKTSDLGLNIGGGFRRKNNVFYFGILLLKQQDGFFGKITPKENFTNLSLMYGKSLSIGKSKIYAMGGIGHISGNRHGDEIIPLPTKTNGSGWFSDSSFGFSKYYESIPVNTVSFPFEIGTNIYCSKNIDIGFNAYAIFSKQENLKGLSLILIFKGNRKLLN